MKNGDVKKTSRIQTKDLMAYESNEWTIDHVVGKFVVLTMTN